MANETRKTKSFFNDFELSILNGSGIDIGCGNDPVTPDCERFDINDGDANFITNFIKKQYDFVYSSHCLEDMHDPPTALLEWWKLVKKEGYMFIIVPDEDLYEQGIFPSLFNKGHKWTFTISKKKSWSPKSLNLFTLMTSLPDAVICKLELQDIYLDRSILGLCSAVVNNDQGDQRLLRYYRFLRKFSILKIKNSFFDALLRSSPVDQTMNTNALAQILCIVKKI